MSGTFGFGKVSAMSRYPTPVERLGRLSSAGSSLWIKRDDLTHPVYGGNKVRKLEKILEAARAKGARRLVTQGAAGSHHVLATAVFGQENGFEVDAVLVPQIRTDHVAENLRAVVGLGVRTTPVGSYAGAVLASLRLLGEGAFLVPVGGSNERGTFGYVEAARELQEQVRAGLVPQPDLVVITLGSGGSAAGLAAGFAMAGVHTRVLGVSVTTPPWAVAGAARLLAWRCARRPVRFSVEGRYLGAGYGHPTPAGATAMDLAAEEGISLDPTYTAKSFACALDRVKGGRFENVLYWHTLSSAPMEPLLRDAPAEAALGPELRRLLL